MEVLKLDVQCIDVVGQHQKYAVNCQSYHQPIQTVEAAKFRAELVHISLHNLALYNANKRLLARSLPMTRPFPFP